MRPTVILVTGSLGSGKSTLGRELGAALRVPMLARDDVRGGLFFTAGAWTPQVERIPAADEATDAFLSLVESLIVSGAGSVEG